jgi:NAD(P)-dependent dehydrogenase (short-subunit alcohol dehydrogenase family)
MSFANASGDALDLNFAGKVVIVSGGASGMGRATATILAEHGADVVIADMNEEAGARVAASIGPRATFEQMNLASVESIESLVARTEERFGKIDGLANVAALTTALERATTGTATAPSFLETTPEQWQRFDDVNHRGLFFLTQAVARSMVRNNIAGSIVHVASSSAYRPVVGVCAYAGTKGAVVSLTRPMARELAQHRIRVNTVSPGHTLSETVLTVTPRDQVAAVETKMGGAKFMEPEHVAEPIVFLLSDAARGMTGAVVHVNRGNFMPH